MGIMEVWRGHNSQKKWMFFIYKDIIWIYANICEQLVAEISGINPEPNLIELSP